MENSASINWQILANAFSTVELVELRQKMRVMMTSSKILFRCQSFNYADGGTCWDYQLILPCCPWSQTTPGGEKLHRVPDPTGAGDSQLPPTARQTRDHLTSQVAGHEFCRSQKAVQYGAGRVEETIKPILSGKVSQAFEIRSLYLWGKNTFLMSSVGSRTTFSRQHNKQVQSTLL